MIPKPASFLNYPLYRLMTDFDWNSTRLRLFRKTIDKCADIYINVLRLPRDQNPQKWERFSLQVLKTFPELVDSEKLWPIHIGLKAARRAANRKRRLGQPLRRLYIGKPPPHYTRLSKQKLSVPSKEPINPSNFLLIRLQASPLSPIACPFCEYLPAIPDTAKTQINLLFGDRELLVQVLGNLGIYNDNQLNVFKKWGEGFLTSLSPHILNPLYKTSIVNRLKLSGHHILQPAPKVEESLTRADFDTSPLWRISGLADQPSCQSIVETLDRELQTGCPDSVSAIGRNAVLAFPVLKPYENVWPVLFHLRWKWERAHKPTMGSSDACLPAEPHMYVPKVVQPSVSNRRQMDEIPHNGCSQHPRVDIEHTPTRLQALLKAFDMMELMPLFVTAQVKRHEDFSILAELDIAERISLFEQLSLPHLKQFQRWMIKVVLRNLDMLD